MATRRKLHNMPVSPLWDHPAVIAMPAAAFGALSRLCIHYWATDCRPLPKDEPSLMQIARAHRPTWRHHKAEIMLVFSEIEEQFRSAMLHRQARRNNLIEAQYASIAARKAKRLAASNASPALPIHAMPHIPKKEPPKPFRPSSKPRRRMVD